MRVYRSLILILLVTMAFYGCRKESPSKPGEIVPTSCVEVPSGFTCTPTATATCWPTATAVVQFTSLAGWGSNGILSANQVQVNLQISGAPYTTAGVTLTGPGLTLSIPYKDSTANGCVTTGNYVSDATWSYQIGQTYTLTIATASVTVNASAQAPGGLTHDRGGDWVRWTTGGNYDFLQIYRGAFMTFEAPPDLPGLSYDIPASAYPWAGPYTLQAVVANRTTGITDATPDSYFAVGAALQVSVSR